MLQNNIVARATTHHDISFVIRRDENDYRCTYTVEVEACFLESFEVENFPSIAVAKRYCEVFDTHIDMIYYVSLEEYQMSIMNLIVEEYERGEI